MTDYKQLCAELLLELENAIRVIHAEDGTRHISGAYPVINKVKNTLAEPEPEGPTDEELMALAVKVFDDPFATDKDYARAVLARWGNYPASPDSSTPQPIPVTERLPGPEDCVVISWSELRSPHVWAGKRRLINGPTEIWDWTFASIPWLEESGEFTHWLPASASVLPAGAIRQSNPSA